MSIRTDSVISTSTLNVRKAKSVKSQMINQYRVVKTLGKGAFATVKLCIDTKTQCSYAINQMSKKFLKKKL